MKSIDTLVNDIYSLFESSVPDMEDNEVDVIIDKFGDALKVHLKKFIYEEERRRDSLRLSAIGKPERQQWYSASPHSNVKETIELQGKDKIKFLYLMTPNPFKENVIAFKNVLPKEFDIHKYIDYNIQF